jgi:hypothetical protein
MLASGDLRCAILSEFNGSESSFLRELRNNLIWRHHRFEKLVELLCTYFEEAEKESFDHELAQRFWQVNLYVRELAARSDFRKNYSPQYYDEANRLLWDMAYQFCMAQRNKVIIVQLRQRLQQLSDLVLIGE